MIPNKVTPKDTTIILDGTLLIKTVLKKYNRKSVEELLKDFFSLLKKQINKIKDSYLKITEKYIIWDSVESGHLRKQLYPQYKANRHEAYFNEESIFQLLKEEINRILKINGFFVYEDRYSEADDCIAFIINQSPTPKNVIVSTDSDFNQLLTKDIYICKLFEKKLVNSFSFLKRNSYICTNNFWFKVLYGDKTDNVPASINFSKLKKGDKITQNKKVFDLLKKDLDENIILDNFRNFINLKQFNTNKILVNLQKPMLLDKSVKNLLKLEKTLYTEKEILNLLQNRILFLVK